MCKILLNHFCSWHVLGDVTTSEGFSPIITTVFSILGPGEISWSHVSVCHSASVLNDPSALSQETGE